MRVLLFLDRLRALLLLVHGLVISLATKDLSEPPRPSPVWDAGESFYLKLSMNDGPELTVEYEILSHSFGEPIESIYIESQVRVEDPAQGWAIGLREDLSGDQELLTELQAEGAGPDLFRALVRKGFGADATLYRLDVWDDAYRQSRKGEELWESYSQGVSRYAFPLRDEETCRAAFELLAPVLERYGARVEESEGVPRLVFPEGTITVARP